MSQSPLTPGQRRLRAQIAANTRWLSGDRAAQAEAMKAGFLAKFEKQVDPDGTLAPEERARRAQTAMTLHMQRLAFKSSKVRSQRKGEPDAAA